MLSNIGVKLLRGNNTIRTISPTNWSTLTTSDLTGVQLLDVILFESEIGIKILWSFAELSFKGSTFRKDTGDLTEDCNDENSKIITAFPNPFNPTTNFTFNLKNSGKVNLSIYDVRGRLVKNLVNSFKSAGKYTVSFDGHHLSSGIYFYRFETDNYMKIDKLMLIK